MRGLPGVGAADFEFSFIDLVVAGGIQRIEILATEDEVGDAAVGGRDDRVHAAGLVADLDAEACGDVEIAVAVDLEAVGKALVVFVAGVQVEVALFVGERAVGLDDVTVNPVRAVVGDVEQRLVRRERDAVGELEAGVDDLFRAVGFDEPDFARFAGAAGGRFVT